jgi:hypothetical protein
MLQKPSHSHHAWLQKAGAATRTAKLELLMMVQTSPAITQSQTVACAKHQHSPTWHANQGSNRQQAD